MGVTGDRAAVGWDDGGLIGEIFVGEVTDRDERFRDKEDEVPLMWFNVSPVDCCCCCACPCPGCC